MITERSGLLLGMAAVEDSALGRMFSGKERLDWPSIQFWLETGFET